jgi:hypothetical protein
MADQSVHETPLCEWHGTENAVRRLGVGVKRPCRRPSHTSGIPSDTHGPRNLEFSWNQGGRGLFTSFRAPSNKEDEHIVALHSCDQT